MILCAIVTVNQDYANILENNIMKNSATFTQKMTRVAGAAAAASVLVGTGAAAAHAVYPPTPENSVTQSATATTPGGNVSFTFGDPTGYHYLPGTTVTVTCTSSTGQPGPGTALAADGQGVANVNFTFQNPGVYKCSATGQGSDGNILTLSAQPVTVSGSNPTVAPTSNATAAPISNTTANGGGTAANGTGTGTSTSGGTTTGSLSQTGGNNTLVVAAIGGGLLLAGTATVLIARHRETD